MHGLGQSTTSEDPIASDPRFFSRSGRCRKQGDHQPVAKQQRALVHGAVGLRLGAGHQVKAEAFQPVGALKTRELVPDRASRPADALHGQREPSEIVRRASTRMAKYSSCRRL